MANLSDFTLSLGHHEFLQLCLSFSPTPKFAEPVIICHDQFCRRLRLHEYFLSNGDANKQPVHNHRCKTRWIPPNGRNTFIDSFVNYTYCTRDQCYNFISNTPHNVKSNLPKQQQGELSNNTNIVIKEADKGGAITIINKEDYIHDCSLILTDNSTYLKTTSHMVVTHNEEAKDIIGNISSNNRSHISQLFPVKATPGTFYAIPKLHKLSHLISTNTNRHMTDGNLINTAQLIDKANSLNIRPPYRPIVSSKRTLTEHISGYVDSILQPLLHNIPSLITDTNDFLRKLNDINHLITPESTMITMDVNSLYTNIPHTDGINACRSFLNRHTTDPALINDIPTLIDYFLTHNLFKFNNDHYLQIKGIAMGTEMAPAYIYISMDAIETSFLSASPLKPSI